MEKKVSRLKGKYKSSFKTERKSEEFTESLGKRKCLSEIAKYYPGINEIFYTDDFEELHFPVCILKSFACSCNSHV